MAGSWGSADFDALKQMRDRFEAMKDGPARKKLAGACCKKLAAGLLSLVIPRTPVGKYPKSSGKTGGTLRRGWTAGKKVDSPDGIAEYAESLPVYVNGDNYTIVVPNPVEYASYVEYGHRIHSTKGEPGYAKPRYMLTKSEAELNERAPQIIENTVEKKLTEVIERGGD